MSRSLWMVRVCLFFAALSVEAGAQTGTGVITGRVLNDLTKNPLVGAIVVVEGTAIRTETDFSGGYRILSTPAGDQTLILSYLGFDTLKLKVRVMAGRTVVVDAEMTTALKAAVTISEPLLEGQAKALNLQKSAINIENVVASDQIGRFPDPNAAEATQRIPGVVVQRDQGEGRYVLVRGTEPRLNSMMINGERIPAPEGDLRQVALDVVPADLLDAIEVSKALTPDMDADSIGGSVNLVTKQAPETTRVSATAGLGYNHLVGDYIRNFNGVVGRRFFNKKFGALVSGSYLNTDRGSDNFEASYDDGRPEEFELRDYLLKRVRQGVNVSLDFRPSKSSEYYLRGIYNNYSDDEFRRAITYNLADGEIDRALRDRYEEQKIGSVSFGGRNVLPNFFQFDYKLSYSYAEENTPRETATTFRQEDVRFRPNFSSTTFDPNNIQVNPQNENVNEFFLDEVEDSRGFTSDQDLTAAFNGAIPYSARGNIAGLFKFGGKIRRKKKMRDESTNLYSPEDDLSLGDYVDPDFRHGRFLNNRYTPGSQFVRPEAARGFLTSPMFESEPDPEAQAAAYSARERVAAGYAMTEMSLGERLTLLSGVRFEHTQVKTLGFDVLFNEDGDFDGFRANRGESSYGVWLPGVHARYRLSDNANLRAAFTRTLARPNYVDLTPYQIIVDEDREIERGNTNLDPTTSWNFDLLGERYFSTVGVVSAGLFYKRLSNNIFRFRTTELRNGEEYDVTQPLNGEGAKLFGIELAFQNRFAFLPGPLNGLGVYSNYTYTNSRAELPGREGVLPGQVKHSGNFAVFYEKFGFSGRAALNYQGRYLSEVGEDADENILFKERLQFDLSLSQRINKHIRIFADLINLNNEPYVVFQGNRRQPIQNDLYSWWGTFGVKFDF